jgi:hypothetical protein
MARKAKNEPYQQMMKSRATTLFCPYEYCTDHEKKANGNINIRPEIWNRRDTEPVQM